MKIPEFGLDPAHVLRKLEQAKSQDVDWKNGRSWSLVYYGGDEHTDFLKQVYALYFSENGAGPSLFPSLKVMEAEVVAMLLDLLNGREECCGTMTSGGTESILLAVKAYRDRARRLRPDIKQPTILAPESAHPALLKAAEYFDVRIVPVPLDSGYACDPSAARNLITDQTIGIMASAPSFPHGVIDPIRELGEIALEREVALHVDACLGGLLLPFSRKLGMEIPDFDFEVPGVTSISTDLHKNGYAAKGASAILYRDYEIRRHQFFVSSDWPGGLQASPTMMGTRPGGAIAAAWAALMVLGENGYLDICRRTMETTNRLMDGIRSHPRLRIVGNPLMSVFGFTADDINIFALGDRIDAMGWRINRQNQPPSLHLVVTPNHAPVVDRFLNDLGVAISAEIASPSVGNAAANAILYGGTENLDQDRDARELLYSKIEKLYEL